ncbi:hypothetical protein OsI_12526 [Oryza sativa Indica Group]|uniref:Uncharacterized protein n=1 Tax=Oryza sativa subsp. indica TaxID=39946 RepID=B8AM53_ORYSI|nr:hypothetical protein OsI_12526 [Oryza sativa Indica Group]
MDAAPPPRQPLCCLTPIAIPSPSRGSHLPPLPSRDLLIRDFAISPHSNLFAGSLPSLPSRLSRSATAASADCPTPLSQPLPLNRRRTQPPMIHADAAVAATLIRSARSPSLVRISVPVAIPYT